MNDRDQDVADRVRNLLIELADRRANPENVLTGAIARMLAVTDAYKLSSRMAHEELEIARRDIEILRNQRTEARKAAKVLATTPTGTGLSNEVHEALRIALNYR